MNVHVAKNVLWKLCLIIELFIKQKDKSMYNIALSLCFIFLNVYKLDCIRGNCMSNYCITGESLFLFLPPVLVLMYSLLL